MHWKHSLKNSVFFSSTGADWTLPAYFFVPSLFIPTVSAKYQFWANGQCNTYADSPHAANTGRTSTTQWKCKSASVSNKNLNDIFCCLQLIPFRSGAVVKEVKRQRVKNHELITNNEHRSKNLIFYKIHTDDKNDGKKRTWCNKERNNNNNNSNTIDISNYSLQSTTEEKKWQQHRVSWFVNKIDTKLAKYFE